MHILVVSQNKGYPIGGLHNKDYNILGSILGSPYLGKLPYCCRQVSYWLKVPLQRAVADNLESASGSSVCSP